MSVSTARTTTHSHASIPSHLLLSNVVLPSVPLSLVLCAGAHYNVTHHVNVLEASLHLAPMSPVAGQGILCLPSRYLSIPASLDALLVRYLCHISPIDLLQLLARPESPERPPPLLCKGILCLPSLHRRLLTPYSAQW
jgi:hypothetical protein